MGAAFDRVLTALDARGCKVTRYRDRATASCPGQGHWRGDQHPSLVVSDGDGCALVYCHAGCHTEDVAAALGLAMADLFDRPLRHATGRPNRNMLLAAMSEARGLAVADRYAYTRLLWKADYDHAVIPPRWQPKSYLLFADQIGVDADTVKTSTAHLAWHRWLAVRCGASNCEREWPHPGRGHRAFYGFGIGEDCTDRTCRAKLRQATEKGGGSTLLRQREKGGAFGEKRVADGQKIGL